MRYRYLLLLAAILVTACSAEKVADNPPAKDATPAMTTAAIAEKEAKEAEAKAAEAKAMAEAELKRIALEAETKYSDLQEGLEKATLEWRNSLSNASSREESTKLIENRPNYEFAAKFLEVAKTYPKTKIASDAWLAAMKNGKDEVKEEAAIAILGSVGEDHSTAKAIQTLTSVMSYAKGEQQASAMTSLLKVAEGDIESDSSFKIIQNLVNARAENEVVERAVTLVHEQADKTKDVNRSAKLLGMLATHYKEDISGPAIDKMVEKHQDHPKMLEVASVFARSPCKKYEDILKTICVTSEGSAKGKALVEMAKYLARRDSMRTYYKGKSDEDLASFSDERKAYLKEESNPDQLDELSGSIEAYVNENKSVLEMAERQLFVLQNLRVGKVVPDIVANDLDGVEFKLSDYRGKVVFLDFWGDW